MHVPLIQETLVEPKAPLKPIPMHVSLAQEAPVEPKAPLKLEQQPVYVSLTQETQVEPKAPALRPKHAMLNLDRAITIRKPKMAHINPRVPVVQAWKCLEPSVSFEEGSASPSGGSDSSDSSIWMRTVSRSPSCASNRSPSLASNDAPVAISCSPCSCPSSVVSTASSFRKVETVDRRETCGAPPQKRRLRLVWSNTGHEEKSPKGTDGTRTTASRGCSVRSSSTTIVSSEEDVDSALSGAAQNRCPLRSRKFHVLAVK